MSRNQIPFKSVIAFLGLAMLSIPLATSKANGQDAPQQAGDAAARDALNTARIEPNANQEPGTQRLRQQMLQIDFAPPPEYRLARESYVRGQLQPTIDLLNEMLRITSRSATMRYRLGAIPLRTLLGECHLQRGDLANAANEYERALDVAIQNSGFLSTVTWGVLTAPTDRPRLDFDQPINAMANSRLLRPNRRRSAPAGLTSTELELWRSAERLPLTHLRRHLMVGVPGQPWLINAAGSENYEQNNGCDIVEVMRQLALSAYRLRWLRGQSVLLRDPRARQLIAATEPPGVVGTDPSFEAAGTLVASMRVVLRYHAGDDSDGQLASPLDQISGGHHGLSPVMRLSRLRSLANRWLTDQQIQQGRRPRPADVLVIVSPSSDDIMQFVHSAREASDVAFALGQHQIGVDLISLAVDQMDRWPVPAELASLLEMESRFKSEVLRNDAEGIAYQLRILSARSAITRGDATSALEHLSTADRFGRSRRLNLPRCTAVGRWIESRALAVQIASATNLPAKDDTQEANDLASQTALANAVRIQSTMRRSMSQWVAFTRSETTDADRISHPLGYRFGQLNVRPMSETSVAERSRTYQSLWDEAFLELDTDLFDQQCFTWDMDRWTPIGVELASTAGQDEWLAMRLDEHQAAAARRACDEMPWVTDLRCILRVSLKDPSIEWSDRLLGRDSLINPVRSLARMMGANPIALKSDAAILHERLQANLHSVALAQSSVPRIEPPPIPIQNDRPDWKKLPGDTAIVAFYLTDESMIGMLVHQGQASHWRVDDLPQVRRDLSDWLLHAINERTLVDEISDDNDRRRAQQQELRLTQTLFPLSCGIDHEAIKRVVLVPDGFLWQMPFKWLVAGYDDQDRTERWGQRYSIQYSHTIGTAFRTARGVTKKPVAMSRVIQRAKTKMPLAASLAEAVPSNWNVGPPGTWGDPIWWARIGGHLQVPVGYSSVAAQDHRNPAWCVRLVQSSVPTVRSFVDPQWVKIETRLRPDTLLQTQVGMQLFSAASQMHAAGIDHVVLNRWPCLAEPAEILMTELELEAGHVPFQDAWQRSIEIVRQSEFSFTDASDPIKSTRGRDDGGALDKSISGTHPRVWGPLLHLPFSDF